MGKAIDLAGRQYGHLTVVAFSHRNERRMSHWNCRCSCGEDAIVAYSNLYSGNSTSCGCGHGLPISDPITHDELLALIHYNPDTGIFTWKVNGRNYRTGDQAGHWNSANPYVRISFKKRSYYAQVIAWFYMIGQWPVDEIDHKDTDKTNNAWDNLREATHTENTQNFDVRQDNPLGLKGVKRQRNRFTARIVANKKRYYLGSFLTAEEAARVYDEAAVRLHGKFARTNFGASA